MAGLFGEIIKGLNRPYKLSVNKKIFRRKSSKTKISQQK